MVLTCREGQLLLHLIVELLLLHYRPIKIDYTQSYMHYIHTYIHTYKLHTESLNEYPPFSLSADPTGLLESIADLTDVGWYV